MSQEPTPAKKKHRWPWWLGATLLLVCALIVATRIAAMSGPGRRMVENQVEALRPAGQEIEIDGLRGDLLGRFTIEHLTIADREGVWLEVDDIVIDWRPLSLTQRRLDLDIISADRTHMLRRPELESSNSGGDTGSGTPNGTLRIGSFDITELILEEAVTTRRLRLTLQSSAAWLGDAAELAMTVSPLEGEGDRVEGKLTWSRTERLTGELAFDSPTGGLIASLAQLGTEQSLSGEIRGNGSLEDWTGEANIRIDDTSVLTTSAQTDGDAIAFSGELNPAPHPQMTQIAAWLASPLAFSGTATPNGNGLAAIQAGLSADRLTSTLAMQHQRNTWQGTLTAEARELHQLADLAGAEIGSLALDGDIVWDDGVASYDGTIDARGLARGDLALAQLSGPLLATKDESEVEIETTLGARGAQLPETLQKLLGAQPRLQLTSTVETDTRTVEIDTLELTGRAATLTASGTADTQLAEDTELAGTLIFDGTVSELASGLALTSDWALKGREDERFEFDVQARSTALPALPAPLDTLIDEQLSSSARGILTRSGTVTVSRFDVEGAAAELGGTLSLEDNGALTLNAQLETDAIANGPVETAPVSAQISATGPTSQLAFNLNARTVRLSAQGTELTGFDLATSGTLQGSAVSAQLNITADSEAGPASLTSQIGLDGSNWRFDELNLQLASLMATGNASGAGGDLESLRAQLDIRGPLPEAVPADTVDATLTLTGDVFNTTGELAGLSASTLSLSRVSWQANGTPDRVDFTTSLIGELTANDTALPLQMDIDGTAEAPLANERALAFIVSGNLADQDFATLETARIAPSPRGMEASLYLSTLGGAMRANLSDEPENRLALDLESISLEALLPLIGQIPRRGDISGSARLHDAGEQGQQLGGTLEATISGLYTVTGSEAPLDLNLTGELRDEVLSLTASSQFEDSVDGSAHLTISMVTRADPFSISPAPDAAMPFDIDMSGAIAPLADLVLDPDLALSGDIDLQMHGALPLQEHGAEGTLSLRNGGFEDARNGLALNEISMDVQVTPTVLELSHFDALGRSGGKLSGDGQMSLVNGATNVEVLADQLVVFDRSEGRLVASGELGMIREDELIRVTGDLELVDGALNLERLPQGGPPTLEVRFDTPDPDEETEPKRPPVTELEVSVRSPRGVRLTGHGVEASLVLDLDITGSIGDPLIAGTGRIQRGRFDLLGKRFEISDSSLQIEGDPNEAELNILAVRNTDELTVQIEITGTPNKPEITLSSQPELPQDEVLSRLLFGRSPSELGPLETARLAAALAQLTGGGGFDLLGGIEESLNLDTVDIGQSSSGAVELTTGKYLAEDVYLELRSSPDAPPGVALEWQPLDNIEVEVETASNAGQSVSVRWKRDFD